VSSFLCAIANSLESLLIYRVAQGMFGAPIMPMGQAILLATFPRHLQPTAIVLWGVGAVFGPVFGPILGSIMAEAYNWRAAFLMIVPPGLAALACIWFALAEHTERTPTRFDWTGFLALSAAIIAAQLVFDRGQKLDWFDSTEIILLTALGIVAFWVFVAHCLTASQPFLNPRLLLDRNFAIGTVIAFVMGMLSFTGLVLFPSLLHDLRDYPDSMIGALLAARGVGNWIAFLIIVPFTRVAPRIAIATGMALQALAGLGMAQLDINVSSFDVIWTNLLQGFGQSIAFTPMTVLAFATLPQRQITEGTAVFTLMRNFGSSLFISLSVLLLVHSTKENYARMTEFITPFTSVPLEPGFPAAWNLATTTGLLRVANEIQRQSAMIGYINAFYLFALTAALSVPLACLLRNPRRLG
jgi:DHA2 family multidrug resistance protein